MNVITVQHTESEHHVNHMVGSWTDWPLTQLGVDQAHNIVGRIAQTASIERYSIYSSDLRRCSWIAQLLQQKTGGELTVSASLRGKHYGSACGKSDAWLETHRRPYLGLDARDIDYRYLDDAENTLELNDRLVPLFDRWLEEKRDLILVGHGDVLNLFYAWWLGIPVEGLRRVDIFTLPGSVSMLKELPNGKRIAVRIGDMSFIQPLGG